MGARTNDANPVERQVPKSSAIHGASHTTLRLGFLATWGLVIALSLKVPKPRSSPQPFFRGRLLDGKNQHPTGSALASDTRAPSRDDPLVDHTAPHFDALAIAAHAALRQTKG